MIGLYIALIIVACIGLIMIIPIKISASFAVNDENSVILKYGFLKFKLYPMADKPKKEKPKKEKSKKDEEKKSDKSKINFKTVWEIREDIKKEVSKILYHVIRHTITLNELNVSSRIGFDDAMPTAIVSGWINAGVYSVIGILDRFARLKKWNVSIEPDFENQTVKIGMHCVISANIAKIITLLIIIMRSYARLKKKMKKAEGVGNNESNKRND